MNEKPTITEILVNNFERDKSLSELADDYEALELEIDNEKSRHGEGTQRFAALKVLVGLRPAPEGRSYSA